MSTVRTTDKSLEIYQGDAPEFEICLSKDDEQIWFTGTPAGVFKVLDDDSTVLIDEVAIVTFGIEGTNSYTYLATFSGIQTAAALRDSERARLVTRIDDDGAGNGPLTWDGKTYDVRVRPAR